MPSKKLYSAAEIASMRLPGLPTTKARIIQRATAEGWTYEEAKGVGGTRRLYDLPARYLDGPVEKDDQATSAEPGELPPVAGTIAAGSAKVDTEQLELAIRALSEWEEERGVKVAPERRPAVIAVLYDYLHNADGDTSALSVVFRALG